VYEHGCGKDRLERGNAKNGFQTLFFAIEEYLDVSFFRTMVFIFARYSSQVVYYAGTDSALYHRAIVTPRVHDSADWLDPRG
jgi:hypothetical protein